MENILKQALSGELKGVVIQIDGSQLRAAMTELLHDEAERAAAYAAEATRNERMTRKEALEMLGIGETTLWKWEKQGIITSLKVGARRFFRRSDIIDLMENQK